LIEKIIVNQCGCVEHLKGRSDANHGFSREGLLLGALTGGNWQVPNPRPVAKQSSESLSTLKQRLGVINQWSQIVRNGGEILALNGTKLVEVLLYQFEQSFRFIHSNSLTSWNGID
jgi:hypothetical protein